MSDGSYECVRDDEDPEDNEDPEDDEYDDDYEYDDDDGMDGDNEDEDSGDEKSTVAKIYGRASVIDLKPARAC